jgi:O-antigen/teichoic acid export membrane protein
VIRLVVSRARTTLRDPLIRNSVLMLATTLLMAVVGSVFWVLAARLGSSADVGLASSLATAAEALAIFAQLGLNVSLFRSMPRSDRKGSDVVVACGIVALAGAVFGVGYACLLPATAPALASVVTSPLTLAVFAVFAAGTAVNQLTDGIFLAVDRVAANLYVNGTIISVAKLALPFLLVSGGAFATFGIIGGSSVAAAALSVFVIVRGLGDKPGLRPSAAFRAATRFAGAGYLSNVLYIAPQLIFPILIIDAQGAAASGAYFISFQIVTLVNHGAYAISASMQAEAEKAPARSAAIVAKAGRTIALASAVGVLLVVAVAPLLLHVFGARYAADATGTLRILALGTLGVAFNYWSAVRLRIAHHLRAMVGVQLFTTALMLALAAWGARHGIEYVAAAWGIGQAAGGLVGYTVSRTIAPLPTAGRRPSPGPRVVESAATPPRPRPRPVADEQFRPRPYPRVLVGAGSSS